MANSPLQFPNLPPVIALVGPETFALVQNGVSMSATATQIATFAQQSFSAVTSLTGTAPIVVDQPTGPVTLSIAANGVTNALLATMAAGTVKANVTGGIAGPTDATPSSVLDIIGSTQGGILYRGASAWAALGSGNAGQALLSNGAGMNPSWGTIIGQTLSVSLPLTLSGGGLLALTTPLAGTYGGTNNAFMQFTGPASTTKTYTLPNASDTIATWGVTNTFSANQVINAALGIGTSSLTGYTLRSTGNITGATTAYGVAVDGVVQSGVTAAAYYYRSSAATAAAAFTVTDLAHFSSTQGTIGAASAVTNQYGFHAASTLTGATNNYGFYGDIAASANRWNLYATGTASNYMAGSLGIGATTLTGYTLRADKTITGAVTSYGLSVAGVVQSGVTTAASYFRTSAATVASAFTLVDLAHFRAEQSTIGAGSAVTNQYGLYVASTLTGATNNFGVYSDIATAANRWNIYAIGTAPNLFTGATTFSSTVNKLTLTPPASGATLTIADGKTFTVSRTLTLTGTDSTTMTFPVNSGTVLSTTNSATLTKGFTVTPNNLGNITDFTIDPTLGNYQYGTNHAAATWTAPASDCSVLILVTNDGSAGTITFSGFTVAAGNTGDTLTTVNGSKFLINIIRINGVSTYVCKSLQ